LSLGIDNNILDILSSMYSWIFCFQAAINFATYMEPVNKGDGMCDSIFHIISSYDDQNSGYVNI